VSLATDYAAYIKAARRLHLESLGGAVADLERLLARTARDLRKVIIETPRGILGERYRRELMASLDQVLDDFRDDYKELLDAGILRSAQIAEQREKDLLRSVLAERDQLAQPALMAVPAVPTAAFALKGAAASVGVSTQIAGVPRRVVELAYSRTYKDGLLLSQRLYKLDQAARADLRDRVVSGLMTGQSARKMAKTIEPFLKNEEGNAVDNIAYRAMRIARTEINTAYREGHIQTVTDPDTGDFLPYVEAIGWRLSPSHPRTDICDALAGDDTEGLGDGNYSAGNVPPGHPHCLCYTVTILVALPDQQFVSRQPRPEDVAESQRRYYGALTPGKPAETDPDPFDPFNN